MANKLDDSMQDIKSIFNNPKVYKFWEWYVVDNKDMDKWEGVQSYIERDLEYATKYYTMREDFQRATVEYTKLRKDYNLVQIYNKMLQQALEGNVSSANWVVNFSQSDFFSKKQNEIDKLIEGFDMEE